jgi:hypothetical protein
MGRISRWLTFLVVIVGLYFGLRRIAPAPLHDFLLFVDDFSVSLRDWIHAAEAST